MPELLLKPSTTVPQSRLQEAYMWSSHNTQGPPCNAAGHCATTCTTSHGVMGGMGEGRTSWECCWQNCKSPSWSHLNTNVRQPFDSHPKTCTVMSNSDISTYCDNFNRPLIFYTLQLYRAVIIIDPTSWLCIILIIRMLIYVHIRILCCIHSIYCTVHNIQ